MPAADVSDDRLSESLQARLPLPVWKAMMSPAGNGATTVPLATAGLVMLVQRWIGSWPATLLIFGAIYIGLAAFVQLGRSRDASASEDWK